jgi:norsolorinic acid ketoreductase
VEITVSKHYGLIGETPVKEFRDHYEINTIGPVVLWQAVQSLLLKSPSGKPQFAAISSLAGSIGAYFPLHAAA